MTLYPTTNSQYSEENVRVIKRLQSEASKVLDALIPGDAHIILLDYPHHPNVGDSLIWLGEITYLKSRGLKPSYTCDYVNYSAANIKKILNKNSIILMHGGGNFGSLWEHLHAFKLQVLRDFPLIPIIQLPQTIHFEGDENLAETVDAIKKHGNFTLLVRSHESLAFAQQHFASTNILCPDMAFFIGPISNKKTPVVDRFILSRTDTEKSPNSVINEIKFNEGTTVQVVDWLEISLQERLIHRIEMHSYWFRRFLDNNNQFLLVIWNLLSSYRLKRGVALLSRGRVVITDRLHAHILSVLMNKPHVLMDNSYGKLSHFYQAWTSDVATAKLVADVNKVNQIADVLDASLCQDIKSDFVQSETAI